MALREFSVLLLLGAIWGASFMFIKVGGREIAPFALVEIRLALAALVMLAVSAAQTGVFGAMRRRWRPLVVMGLINCAVPYTLITWGETYISSGLAAIYNACAPLWAAAILLTLPGAPERPTPRRLIGLLVGMAGVVLVVSSSLQIGNDDPMQWVGQGACLLAALSYAVSGIYGRRVLSGVPAQVSATGQLIAGSLMLLPLAATQVPAKMPSWIALGAVAALAVAGTALASLMYYWLLKRVGATGTLLVTYLLPVFALVWGALLLAESFTAPAVAGLALVLLGIWVTSSRARAAAEPAKVGEPPDVGRRE